LFSFVGFSLFAVLLGFIPLRLGGLALKDCGYQ